MIVGRTPVMVGLNFNATVSPDIAVHHDRRSPIRLFIEAVKGVTITPFVRWICAVLVVAYGFMAWDPLFHSGSDAYDQPVYEAVFRFASPLAWGLGFLLCAVFLMLSAITARAALYVMSIFLASVTLLGWASMIIYQAWTNPSAELASGSYGLYLGTMTAVVGLAFSPRQLTIQTPIIAVIDNDDDQVVRRMKRIERVG